MTTGLHEMGEYVRSKGDGCETRVALCVTSGRFMSLHRQKFKQSYICTRNGDAVPTLPPTSTPCIHSARAVVVSLKH